MNAFRLALIALACVFSSGAFAARPAAPRITVEVNDIKQLRFDWPSVPGASRYELWFKANDATPWQEYTEKPAPRTSLIVGVSVHLLHWQQARYQLKACNSSGCSTSNTVRVNHDEKLAALGYFKPTVPYSREYYGSKLAVSADGSAVAVLSADAMGEWGLSASVHVFRRSAPGSGWHLEARLLPSTRQEATAQPYSGDPIAISADGNLIALGTWTEKEEVGINPDQPGAVYLFRRLGTDWQLTQKLTGVERSFDSFGIVVKLDDAGRTLVIQHRIHGGQLQDGTLEVYRDPGDGSGQFVHDSTLLITQDTVGPRHCDGIALSGDGRTMLRGCRGATAAQNFTQVLTGPDFTESARLAGGTTDGVELSYDGTQALVQNEDTAFAYRRGSRGWVQEAVLGNLGGINDSQHRRIALSRDGKIAAFGNYDNRISGVGPVFPPYQTSETYTGAVVIHERKSSGWVVRRVLKPGSTNDQWFGHSVALGDNGRILAVGAPYDPSSASGINGDRDDNSNIVRGAVWIH